RVLERVIATCPDLCVFKLHDINYPFWVPELSLTKDEPVDEERLWNHVRDSCPKIDWYHVLPAVNIHVNRIETLERMRQSGVLGRCLTTTCIWTCRDLLQDLNVRRVLNNVTVLEVLPVYGRQSETQSFQQLLCQMPNLLHVIAPNMVFVATEVLVIPGVARPEILRDRFNHHNRGRKRLERKEKRQQRQKALERFQVPKQDRLAAIPEVWQCRDLRTMAMDFDTFSSGNFSLFTQYVETHRLLRNLTLLSIGVFELRVGQVKKNPIAEMAPPERWENNFLPLRGLRCLETLEIKTQSIVGVIQAADFEFLRKRNHSQIVMFFISAKNKDAGSDLEEEDSARNQTCGPKERTFWPHLQSLHIKYRRVQTATTNFTDVVAGMEQIRPGVEFVIKHCTL
ncbi:hypothetical protein BGZ72_005864, partial [Mortierella alpina]